MNSSVMFTKLAQWVGVEEVGYNVHQCAVWFSLDNATYTKAKIMKFEILNLM